MGVRRIWLMLTTALLLTSVTAGCSSAPQSGQTSQTSSVATTQPTPQQSDGYPGPAAVSTDDPAYPGPASGAPVDPVYPGPEQRPTQAPPPGRAPEPVPTPASGMGVIHGSVYDITTDQPIYDGVMVLLSQVIQTDSSDMDAVRVDQAIDPKVSPDVEGGFAFGDVPPGRYGIVVQGPLSQHLARYADDQTKDVIVTVEAGQTVDLGKIYTTFP